MEERVNIYEMGDKLYKRKLALNLLQEPFF